MGRKSKKQRAIDLPKELNQNDLFEVQQFLDSFELGSPENSYSKIEPLFDRLCSDCGSPKRIKKYTQL